MLAIRTEQTCEDFTPLLRTEWMTDFAQLVAENGYAIVQGAVPDTMLQHLDGVFDGRCAGLRNLLSAPVVRELASSEPIRELVKPILGRDAFAVRAILFKAGGNKLESKLASRLCDCRARPERRSRLGAMVSESWRGARSTTCCGTGGNVGSAPSSR